MIFINSELSQKCVAFGCLLLSIAAVMFFRVQSLVKLTSEEGLRLFIGSDAYYHYRNVIYYIANFPNTLDFDAYMHYPSGMDQPFMPLYDMFISYIAWAVGLGQPSQDAIYNVCVYMPVVFAVITVIVTFFLVRELFENAAIGIWAAAFLAVMPGVFFATSMAGYNDSHIAAVMLSTMMIYILVHGLRYLKFADIGRESGKPESRLIKKAIACSALAGIIMCVLVHVSDVGLYLAPVLLVYFVIKQVDDYIHGIDIEIQTIFAAVFFAAAALAWILMMDITSVDYIIVCMGVVCVVELFAGEINRRKKSRREMYLCVCACLILFLIFAHFNHIGISDCLPRITEPATTAELKSIFSIDDNLYWSNFALCGYFTILSLGLLFLRKLSGMQLFVFVWSVGTLVAAVIQSRFAGFFAVNAAIMTAYGFSELWDYLKVKCQHMEPTLRSIIPKGVLGLLIILTVAQSTLLLEKDISQVCEVEGADITLSEPWLQTLEWLRNNTPDPGVDMNVKLVPTEYANENAEQLDKMVVQPEGKFAQSRGIIPTESFIKYVMAITQGGTHIRYPEEAYGVLSSEKYGNYIQVIGQRMPAANQYVNDSIASNFFSAQSEAKAIEQLPGDGDIKYIVTDLAMATSDFETTTKLGSSEYSRVAMKSNETVTGTGERVNISLTLPAEPYYNSMVFRLQVLDGTGLKHFRLVHESEPVDNVCEPDLKSMYDRQCNASIDATDSGYVKVFEHVKGANVTGTAQPGTHVTITAPITTNLGRIFEYTQTVVVGNDSVYTLTVPYAQLYTVTNGETETVVAVNGTEVMCGITKSI